MDPENIGAYEQTIEEMAEEKVKEMLQKNPDVPVDKVMKQAYINGYKYLSAMAFLYSSNLMEDFVKFMAAHEGESIETLQDYIKAGGHKYQLKDLGKEIIPS